jgi:hypothetical protein
MSSVDNSITADGGKEQENKTNSADVVQDAAATDTVADDPSTSNDVPNDDTNVNVSLEQLPDVTGIHQL